MNNVRDSIFGIDVTIQKVQEDLYSYLSSDWSGILNAYGRVYKNIDHDANQGLVISREYIPEWYNASEDDYEDVYYDDNGSATMCFIVSDQDTTEDSIVYNTSVKVVFMVDLGKIYSCDSERLDSKAHRDAVEALRNISHAQYDITGIDKGIDTVYNGFDVSKIGFNDLQPLHCFSININLQYYLTDKC